jgi:GT2 family glycosyltransferase
MAEGKRIATATPATDSQLVDRPATSQPLVSIITINYNQAETTRQFLDSLRTLAYPNYEVIVVDNASVPRLTSVVDPATYPGVRVVRSEENLGFTGGNNLGMAAANGDYFFIVNNDTELNPSLLDRLLEPFATDPRIGVTCPKIRSFAPPHELQYAGYSGMNRYTGTARPLGLGQPDSPAFDQPGPTPFAHGCAMLVRRAVVERVGRFADRFFLYYEELDWSQRITDAGFVIYYQPLADILHKESVSVGRGSPLRTYYLTRNRILWMRRHGSLVQRWVFYLFFATCVLPKHLLVSAVGGQWQHARAFLRGVVWNLTASSQSPV